MLVPLVAGVALYGWLWSGWAAAFRTEVAGWLPGRTVTVSGFPYRIEATADTPQLSGGSIVVFTASAARAIVNRGPWQPDLTVISSDAPRFSVAVGGVGAATAMRADIAGKTALSSIHVEAGRVARLSTVIEAASGRLGILTPALTADALEVHLREVPGRLPEPWSATLPGRGQAVISAERLRIGGGDALTLAADFAVTGAARLTDFARWADGGTIELRALSLSDAHGEVAGVAATLVPIGRTGMRIAGTITTICPEAVVAAFDGTPPPRALRLRQPLRLAFEATMKAGTDRTMTARLAGDLDNLATRARRGQEPPCPVIRGAR